MWPVGAALRGFVRRGPISVTVTPQAVFFYRHRARPTGYNSILISRVVIFAFTLSPTCVYALIPVPNSPLPQVKSALDDIAERGAGGSIMVVGAGYSGVELAATLAELVRGKGVTVQLVTPGGDVLEGCPAGQQEAARQALAGLGVQVVTGKRVQQIKSGALDSTAEMGLPSSCSVYLEAADGRDYGNGSGTRVESDLVVWTAGSAPVTKAARQGFPFPATEKGAIRTVRACGHGCRRNTCACEATKQRR